jgi:hypothetical protein
MPRSQLLKRFKRALERAGVRPLRFHDLRHTSGTRMAAAGVPMRALPRGCGAFFIPGLAGAPSRHRSEMAVGLAPQLRDERIDDTALVVLASVGHGADHGTFALEQRGDRLVDGVRR